MSNHLERLKQQWLRVNKPDKADPNAIKRIEADNAVTTEEKTESTSEDAQLTELKSKYEKLRLANRALKAELEEKSSVVDSAPADDNARLQAEFDVLKAEYETALSNLDEVKKELEEANASMEQFRDDVESLKDALATNPQFIKVDESVYIKANLLGTNFYYPVQQKTLLAAIEATPNVIQENSNVSEYKVPKTIKAALVAITPADDSESQETSETTET